MSRVLIIEDEAVLRTSMARGLRKVPGLEVDEAVTMAEALAAIDRAAPDLVLSDLDLPDRSGVEILGELGKRGLKVPIVFVSAYLKAFAAQIPRHADVEVREKPISLEEIRALVAHKTGADGTDPEASPFSATDLLQLACMGRHSVAIEIHDDQRTTGTVLVSAGEVWSAEDDGGKGPDAFRRILFEAQGRVTCRTLREPPRDRNIHGGWQELLIEAARIEDERGQPVAAEPEDTFDRLWDDGVSSLLKKDYASAFRAFKEADRLRPGDRKVEANLARLRDMGVPEPE